MEDTYRSIFRNWYSMQLCTFKLYNFFPNPSHYLMGKCWERLKLSDVFSLLPLPAPTPVKKTYLLAHVLRIRHNCRSKKQRVGSVMSYFYQLCFESFRCAASFIKWFYAYVSYKKIIRCVLCCLPDLGVSFGERTSLKPNSLLLQLEKHRKGP